MSFGAREVVYRFLAWLYLYPDASRLQTLKEAAVALSGDDWWQGLPFAPAFERLFAALSAVDDLAAAGIVNEYNRLFLVKPLAPPHESFYLDSSGQFRGWMAAKLQGIYAENGLALSPTMNEMPDHLAVELEFVSHLCSVAYDGDGEIVKAATASQCAFLSQHLAKWFPKFAKRVKEADPQHHYRATVEVTFLFLRSELASLAGHERRG
jgi:TorA maturation chaperone TorD